MTAAKNVREAQQQAAALDRAIAHLSDCRSADYWQQTDNVGHYPEDDAEALKRLRVELSATAAGDAEVTYELWQGGEWNAAADTEADIAHYAMMYGQDGPVTVYRVHTKRERIEELSNEAAQESP